MTAVRELGADVRAAAAQLVQRSTTAQQLPAVVEDVGVLGRVAALVRPGPALDAKPRRRGEVDCAEADR